MLCTEKVHRMQLLMDAFAGETQGEIRGAVHEITSISLCIHFAPQGSGSPREIGCYAMAASNKDVHVGVIQ